MKFVKENQCLSWHKNVVGINQCYVLGYRINFISVIKNLFILALECKVDFNNMGILLLSEVLYRHGFSNLAGSTYNQWLSIGSVLPVYQYVINLSLEHIEWMNHIIGSKNNQKITLSGRFFPENHIIGKKFGQIITLSVESRYRRDVFLLVLRLRMRLYSPDLSNISLALSR